MVGIREIKVVQIMDFLPYVNFDFFSQGKENLMGMAMGVTLCDIYFKRFVLAVLFRVDYGRARGKARKPFRK